MEKLMCGFIGVYGSSNFTEKDLNSSLNHLKNRGPDAQQVICNPNELLGFARLSIRDLSNDGMQPMFSDDEKYSIVFNGEVYNYFELKNILINDGVEINSNCDTEVLFKYFLNYGIEKTLHDVEGMYAFSINDKINKKIYFARDLIGEKPIFYYHKRNNIIISSNLYSIIELTKNINLNLKAVSNFLHYGYGKGLETSIKNISKLEPGSYAVFDENSGSISNYSYKKSKLSKKKETSYEANHFEKDLINSIKNTLVADVPVGCFLSGGIDSSLISSIAKELKSDLKTFSVGFNDKNYDESSKAKEFALQLDTDHHEIVLDEEEIYDTILNSKWVFDEPFSDASFVAMLSVSKYARKYVTVCLSGDGGDELFSGYNRHLLTSKIYQSKIVPKSIRKLISMLLRNGGIINSFIKKIYRFLPSKIFYIQAFEEKLDKFAIAFAFENLEDLYFRILAGEKYNERLNVPSPDMPKIQNENFMTLSKFDLFNYIHEDVLVKVDRSTMANSLEARAPFLNSNLINFSIYCDKKFHVGNYGQKNLLKELLLKRNNSSNHKSSKKGFSVPYKNILDKKLKSSFYEMFDNIKKSENDKDFFKEIKNLVNSYYQGKFHDYKLIWNIYFFIRWYCNVCAIADKDVIR